MTHPELQERPKWQRTGDAYFPAAARVGGRWWVLRVNSFPDHPLWTLFVDGSRRFDVDDPPDSWGSPVAAHPPLAEQECDAALAPLREFVAYGSEVGEPCDNPFCCGQPSGRAYLPNIDAPTEHSGQEGPSFLWLSVTQMATGDHKKA